MGIIVRQSIKTSAVNFLGVVVGFLSTLFIYPLHREAYGFANNIYTISSFIAAFTSMGIAVGAVKFFPEFKNPDQKHPSGFFSLLILYVILSLIIFGLIGFLFKDLFYGFLNKSSFNSKIFSDYSTPIILITICLSFITLFSAYSSNAGRITIPSLLNNFSYKIFLPIVILLVYLGIISLLIIPSFQVAFYFIVLVILFFYVKKLGIVDFGVFNFKAYKNRQKEMISFMALSSLTSIGSLLTFKIDTVMISGFLGYVAAGTYGLPMAMANVIDVPNQAINSITAPIISGAWKNNDFKSLSEIYKKASLNLLMAGLIILLIGYFSFDNLGQLSSNPDAFKNGKIIFLIIGLAKLVDLATSVNGSLISYSANYKYNLYFIAVLAGLNIYLNILFIPKYGLPGAAYATFISIFIFNSLKVLFLQYKYKIHPFSKDMIVILALSAFLVLILSWLNLNIHPIINISLTGLIVLSSFGLLIYKSNISPEGKSLLIKLKGYLSF